MVECVNRKKNFRREDYLFLRAYGHQHMLRAKTREHGKQTGLGILVVYAVNNEENVKQS